MQTHQQLDLRFFRLATIAMAIVYPLWHWMISFFYPEVSNFFLSSLFLSLVFGIIAAISSYKSIWLFKNLHYIYIFEIALLLIHLFLAIETNAKTPIYLLVQFASLSGVAILLLFVSESWFKGYLALIIILEAIFYFPQLSFVDSIFSLLALLTGLFFLFVLRSYFSQKSSSFELKISDIQKENLTELKQNYEREKAISSILKISNSAIDLNTKLHSALGALFKISWLNVENKGGIFLLNDSKDLELTATYNLHPEILKRCKYVKNGECLCGKVAESGKIIHAECVDHHHTTTYEGMLNHGHYILPIKDEGKILGVIVIYLNEGHRHEQGEIDFLELVAETLGTLIGSFLKKRRLEVMESQLMQTSKLATLGEITAGIGHEIKTPLTVVGGYSLIFEQMGRGDIPVNLDVLVKAGEQISKNIQRIIEIIDNLKRFARNDESEEAKKFFIREVIEDSIELTHKKAEKAGVKVFFKKSEINYSLLGHRTQICQVVVNLLNNGIEAVQNLSEKWIKVEIKEVDKNLKIRITDSGRGIDPSIVMKLMTPFFSTKELGQGAGLGLSISHSIVVSHSGRLEFDRDSLNTSFVVSLPLPKE